MKKRFWLGVLALTLVFGLVFVSCDEADDNGGDGFIGGTLNLSGQVWGWDYDGDDSYDWVQFTGDRATVTSDVGGSGSITNGQLSFSVGTPSVLGNIQQQLFIDGLVMEEWFNDFSLSPSSARGAVIEGLRSMPGGGALHNGWASGNFFESVVYIYVDRDVRMTGTGRTITFECNCEEWHSECNCEEWDGDCYCVGTTITRNFDLNLTAGWNVITVIEELNPTGRIETLEITPGASPRARWTLWYS
ncbi:MAG: hypothetical protein FWC97_06785 [Treponema sp.]|nr:hypothetical protein [Treponema sp.]